MEMNVKYFVREVFKKDKFLLFYLYDVKNSVQKISF